MKRGLPSNVDLYLENLYGDRFRKYDYIRNSADRKIDIQISPQEGQLLSILLSLQKTNIMVEIGTYVGYSAAWISSVLPKEGKVFSFEINRQNYEKAKENIKQLPSSNKINLVHGDARENMHKYVKKGEVDAFFIDGKKSEYIAYLNLAKIFLRKGGVLIADNTIISRSNVSEQNIIEKIPQEVKSFNKVLAGSNDFESFIINTKSGMTIAIKN